VIKNLKHLLTASTLLLLCATASAQSTGDRPVLDNAAANAKEICAAHPDQCAKAKQNIQADCQANPARCQQAVQNAKQAEANIQAKCAANPAKCQQVRGNMERRQNRRQNRRIRRQTNQGTLPAGQ
jgi:Skp family chaperone for outer membrane proteins